MDFQLLRCRSLGQTARARALRLALADLIAV